MNKNGQACCLLLMASVVVCNVVPGSDFAAFMERVQKRDPRTKAIVRVRASDETRLEHGITDFWCFEIKAEGDTATVKVFNNYKTGPIEESYSFQVDDAVKRELTRYRNQQELQILDAAVAKVLRERRIFLLSNFRLKVGAGQDEIEQVLGKPAEVHSPTEAGSLSWEYARLYVSIKCNRLWDIQLKRD